MNQLRSLDEARWRTMLQRVNADWAAKDAEKIHRHSSHTVAKNSSSNPIHVHVPSAESSLTPNLIDAKLPNELMRNIFSLCLHEQEKQPQTPYRSSFLDPPHPYSTLRRCYPFPIQWSACPRHLGYSEVVPRFQTLDMEKAPWSISHVCMRWRSIVLDAPELWRDVEVDLTRAGKLICDGEGIRGGKMEYSEIELKKLRMFLSRSKELPLRVVLAWNIVLDDRPRIYIIQNSVSRESFADHLEGNPILQIILRESHRIQHLTMINFSDGIPYQRALGPRSYPLLESLTLIGDIRLANTHRGITIDEEDGMEAKKIGPAIFREDNSPRLEKLGLASIINPSSLVTYVAPGIRARALKWRVSDFASLSDVLDGLSHVGPWLEELDVTWDVNPKASIGPDLGYLGPIVEMPELRKINVRGVYAAHICSYLTFPASCKSENSGSVDEAL